tara:strand:- start:151 stop:558 length:408 start_codon:yes stop_codon:yes gene_type:complete
MTWGRKMVATRNQQHVIARSFGSVPNGSMPTYFSSNELGQYYNPREVANPVMGRKHLGTHMAEVHGTSLGFLGTGKMDSTVAIALGMIYVGLGFPGAKPAAKQIKKVIDRPIPVLQNLTLLTGVAVLMYRQFKEA